MATALVSVSDKTGLVDFATGLVRLGWSLVSTGGTAAALRTAGVPVRDVPDLTGMPEMLDGRVKTLHPAVHGGILARRDHPNHSARSEAGIQDIGLVVVNLYPFRETAARPNVDPEDVIEQIDIGGPALLRSAAKNFAAVTAVVDPGGLSRACWPGTRDAATMTSICGDFWRARSSRTRRRTMRRSPRGSRQRRDDIVPRPASHCRTSGRTCCGTVRTPISARRSTSSAPAPASTRSSSAGGKELSFNNLLDLEGALVASRSVSGSGRDCCAIIKHTTPCGLATGATCRRGVPQGASLRSDVGVRLGDRFTVPVDDAAADGDLEPVRRMHRGARVQRERARDPRPQEEPAHPGGLGGLDAGRARLQARARRPADPGAPPAEPGAMPSWRVVSSASRRRTSGPTSSFAWRAVASVKSNAIVIAKPGRDDRDRRGPDVPSRRRVPGRAQGRPAGLTRMARSWGRTRTSRFGTAWITPPRSGVTAIIQPGGSVKDSEVIAAADERGMAMVLTGRTFRH